MNAENELIAQVQSGFGTRRRIVPLYRQALSATEPVNWDRIHQAILDRWSHFAVEWIRREAKKNYHEITTAEVIPIRQKTG